MFKSNIFFKAMAIFVGAIVVYTFAVLIFALPKIDTSIQSLEEKVGKGELTKIVTIVKNTSADLKNFKKHLVKMHKTELQDLTSVTWTIIKAKYEQSKPENIGKILEKRGREFKKNLMQFYLQK